LDALGTHLDVHAGAVWLFQSPVNDDMSIHRSTLHITYWKPLLKASGLPQETRFHDLRHTAASLLLGEGVPVPVVSQLLGHADSGITLKVYAHMLPDHQSTAALAMNGIVHDLLLSLGRRPSLYLLVEFLCSAARSRSLPASVAVGLTHL